MGRRRRPAPQQVLNLHQDMQRRIGPSIPGERNDEPQHRVQIPRNPPPRARGAILDNIEPSYGVLKPARPGGENPTQEA